MARAILTLSCPDRIGIVHAVSGFLVERGANILDSAQFGDPATGLFFMRLHLEADASAESLRLEFAAIAERFGMDYVLRDEAVRPRALVLVSRFGHCLNDLLYRHAIRALPVDIPAVVSNHPDFRDLTAGHGIPFRHLPVTPDTKAAQEAALWEIVERERIDVVVLARYMQVLSAEFCARMPGRIINIHHSFLPSFKGARPYHQAHALGVKLIGATAHYVTADLDEGPIIEQETVRVDHSMGPDELAAVGRDIENVVLARAVTWHAEQRVLLNGRKTVVFR